jgi:hypothetical protein
VWTLATCHRPVEGDTLKKETEEGALRQLSPTRQVRRASCSRLVGASTTHPSTAEPHLQHILGGLVAFLGQQHVALLLIHGVVNVAGQGACNLGGLTVWARRGVARGA